MDNTKSELECELCLWVMRCVYAVSLVVTKIVSGGRGAVDNWGGYVSVGQGLRETPVPSPQFCFEPQVALCFFKVLVCKETGTAASGRSRPWLAAAPFQGS